MSVVFLRNGKKGVVVEVYVVRRDLQMILWRKMEVFSQGFLVCRVLQLGYGIWIQFTCVGKLFQGIGKLYDLFITYRIKCRRVKVEEGIFMRGNIVVQIKNVGGMFWNGNKSQLVFGYILKWNYQGWECREGKN